MVEASLAFCKDAHLNVRLVNNENIPFNRKNQGNSIWNIHMFNTGKKLYFGTKNNKCKNAFSQLYLLLNDIMSAKNKNNRN